MPIGLDLGTYQVFVSTNGKDFIPQGISTFTIKVMDCPDGSFCS